MAPDKPAAKGVAAKPKKTNKADAPLQDAIDQLFAFFHISYPGQFEKRFKDDQILQITKNLWYRQLTGLSPQQITKGMDVAARSSKYIPSIAEFIGYCENPDALPAQTAWHMALDLASSEGRIATTDTPASVYYAAQSAGWNTLLELPQDKSEALFSYHYQQTLKRIASGKTLDIPQPPAIEAPKPLSASQSLQRLQELRHCLAKASEKSGS
jgi:hypothetical protein